MKINEFINESTTAGAIATVAAPMTTQKRNDVGKGVYGNEKPGNLLTGKKTSKKYANSVNESKMKQLASDLETMQDGNFKQKYKKTKEQIMAVLGTPSSLKPKSKNEVNEAQLDEEDLIIVPGQGHRLKSGFIPHDQDRRDHEVEMARGDLFQAYQNAEKIHKLIKDVTEDEGLEGWVQAKITKAADYLNSVRQYLEGKHVQETGGVIAGGGVGESTVQSASKKLEVYGNRHGFYIFLPNGNVLTANKLPASVQQDNGDGSYYTSSSDILPDPDDDKEAWDKLAWNVEDAGPYSPNGNYMSFAKRYMEPVNAFNLPPEVKAQVKQFMQSAKKVSEEGKGLWANIHAKRERIKHGSGERMRKPGSKGAPSAQDFKDAANEDSKPKGPRVEKHQTYSKGKPVNRYTGYRADGWQRQFSNPRDAKAFAHSTHEINPRKITDPKTQGGQLGDEVNEGVKEKIKGVIRREKAKDLPLLQTRRDYAMTKTGDAYEKGNPRKAAQYSAWAERDRKKHGDPSDNPAGTYRTKTTDYMEGAMVDNLFKVRFKNTETGETKDIKVRAPSAKEARSQAESDYTHDSRVWKCLGTKEITNEAQSMGTALKNTLAKAEPGSKLDQSIKRHNANIKAGQAGTLKDAPTGYHFDKKGYCRLGDK